MYHNGIVLFNTIFEHFFIIDELRYYFYWPELKILFYIIYVIYVFFFWLYRFFNKQINLLKMQVFERHS